MEGKHMSTMLRRKIRVPRIPSEETSDVRESPVATPEPTTSLNSANEANEDEEDDNEEYTESDSRSNRNSRRGASFTTVDSEVAVVRTVLARHLKYQMIRREHLSSAINQANASGSNARDEAPRSGNAPGYINSVIKDANRSLGEIFGIELQTAPLLKEDVLKNQSRKKRKTTSNNSNNGGNTNSEPEENTNASGAAMGLVSKLSPRAKNVLHKLYDPDVSTQVDNERNTNDAQFYLPKYHGTASPFTNIELIKSGVMLVVVMILIIQENHINESDLIKMLDKFGISANLNHRIPNLNVNLAEFLGELVRRNYIVRHTPQGGASGTNSTGNGGDADYSLGARSFMEFSPYALVGVIKEIYGEKFDADVKRKVAVTIERTYGEAIQLEDDQAENDEQGGNAEDEDDNEQDGEQGEE